jgi:hypothetical protein
MGLQVDIDALTEGPCESTEVSGQRRNIPREDLNEINRELGLRNDDHGKSRTAPEYSTGFRNLPGEELRDEM